MPHFTLWGAKRMLCLLVILTSIIESNAQLSVSYKLDTKQKLTEDWFGYDGQNVIRGGVSWVDPDVCTNVPLIKPQLLRYPSTFSFWDWKKGWFVESPLLPSKYASLTPMPNYLENFKKVLDSSNADALFTLNMVTATLQDQIAMLKHADSIGIPVKYVELGSEYYLSSGDEDAGEGMQVVDSIYPTPRSYALTANVWIDSIHKHFPQVKVSVCASFEKYKVGRRGIWNDSIRPVLSGREDAWSFHIYWHSSWGDSTETDYDLSHVTSEEVPDWMNQPHIAMAILKQSIADVNPGKDVWITEYNLHDMFIPVQGLWGHGLYNSLLTILFLQEPRVTHITCHAMDGSALFGQYFTDSLGFSLTPGDDDSTALLPDPPKSTPWALTASGHALKMVGESVEDMDYYSRIRFSNTPKISVVESYGRDTFSYDGLEGVMFNNSQGSNTFLMNLTDEEYKLTFNNLYPSGTHYTLKSGDPIAPVANSSDVTITTGVLSSSLQFPPHSILKISSSFVPSAAPSVQITANGPTTFCEGDSVRLDAGVGYLSYLWSTGEKTRMIWAHSNGSYWVHAISSLKAYAGADTMNITVNPLPEAPTVMSDGATEFCADKSRTLFLKDPIPAGYTCQWSTGATTPTITVATSGNYTATLTDTLGCSATSIFKTITVNPLPDAYITASGSTTFCDGGSVVLTAYPSGETYKWSNGGKTTQSITVNTSSNMTVTVTDAKGCKITTPATSTTKVVLPNPTITTFGASTYCVGSGSTYLQTITGYSYQWLKGESPIGGATQQSYTPTSTGTYKAKITDGLGCTRSTMNGKTITINSIPAPSITTDKINICNGATALLSVNSGVGWTYQWLKNDGKITGATNTTYSASKAATYKCKATITSSGCTATSNEIVITANCKMDGEDNEELKQLVLYPNPTDDQIHVLANLGDGSSGSAQLEIRNALGQLVYSDIVPVENGKVETTLSIDNQFAAGIYLVGIRRDNVMLTEEIVVK